LKYFSKNNLGKKLSNVLEKIDKTESNLYYLDI